MYMILIHGNNFGKLVHIVWCKDIIIHFSHVFNPSTFISLFLFARVLSAVCTTAQAESRRVFLDRDSSRMKLVIIVQRLAFGSVDWFHRLLSASFELLVVGISSLTSFHLFHNLNLNRWSFLALFLVIGILLIQVLSK